MVSSPIFELDKLTITYGRKTAVSALDLRLLPGTSLGLLGRNGSGKTSTIKSLLGLVRPKSGKVSVLGGHPGSVPSFRAIGFVPEEATPPEYLTANEYFRFVGSLRGESKAELKSHITSLCERFEIEGERRIRDLSKGQKRRIVLAQAVLGNPRFLILDEPLNGLDPVFILRLRDSLNDFLKSGGTILYCSHLLSEVERTCTDVAILSDGKLVVKNTVPQLVTEFGSVEMAFAKAVGA